MEQWSVGQGCRVSDHTRVGLFVFLLFLTSICPAARPKLQWWMIYSFPRQHIPYPCAPLLVPWKKISGSVYLFQFKPIDSYPISHGYEGQIILQHTYACLRTAAMSFPDLFFSYTNHGHVFSLTFPCKPGKGAGLWPGCWVIHHLEEDSTVWQSYHKGKNRVQLQTVHLFS